MGHLYGCCTSTMGSCLLLTTQSQVYYHQRPLEKPPPAAYTTHTVLLHAPSSLPAGIAAISDMAVPSPATTRHVREITANRA